MIPELPTLRISESLIERNRPKGPTPNKYEKPHQGKRERARRMRQLANTAKKQAAGERL